ncbi:hypothetical protein DYQ86_25820 [Acidobacteria bacterium AB60]|nr:hypothetical protein DYQ86_25820 [Acidobacteria bacterium AB60]
MKVSLLPLLLCAATGLAVAQNADVMPAQHGPENLNVQNEPPMLGIHWAHDFQPGARAQQDAKAAFARRGANMTYHGGKIMPTATTQAIFWGTSWGSYSGDKITGIDQWYEGFNGSNYAKTSDEYTGTNGQVTATTTHLGHIIDTSPSTGGGSTSTILNEVCKLVSPDASGNGYYAVYTDTPRGNANYCAWHSYGTCGGKPVQFAYFFKLDGDAGCDPQDTSGLHSQGLAAIANVSGHELSEARSDPATPGAWYDSSGAENGDKCAWTFGAPLVTFSNQTQWKIQGEWSNAAYTAGTGYPNSSGQKGCLSGK